MNAKTELIWNRSLGWVIKAMLLLGFIGAAYLANSYFQLITWPDRISYSFLWLAGIAQLLFWTIATISWRLALMETTGKSVPLWDCFVQIVMVLVGKYLPGKVWGVAARSQQLTRFDIPHRSSLVATYLEHLISVIAGMVVGLFAWLEAGDYPYRWWIYMLVFVGLAVATVYHARLLAFGFSWLSRRYPAVGEAIALTNLPARSYLALFLLYIAEWLAIGAILVCLFAAFSKVSPSPDLILFMVGSNAIGMIVGFMAFFSPGGIGVREGVIVGLLVTEIPLAEATFLVVCYRLWLIATDALAGIAVFAIYQYPIKAQAKS